MPKYKLVSDFWDGRRMHRKGTVLSFEEGKAPKTAKPVESPAPVVEEDEGDDTTSSTEEKKEPEKSGSVKVVDKK